MYVDDYEKYPGNGAVYTGGIFTGNFGRAGMDWLKPYLGKIWDPKYWAFTTNGDGSFFGQTLPESPAFTCPAEPPLPAIPLGFPWSDYGYNEMGTVWKPATGELGLGLGYVVEQRNLLDVDVLGPIGARMYARPGQIKAPSNLIAIGDGDSWLAPQYPLPIETVPRRDHTGSVYLPHTGRANMVFCDGHVESATGEKWAEATDSARKRWNKDNQPHPETW